MSIELPSSIESLEIVRYPDPVLRQKCERVASFDDKLAELVRRMEVLLREANGVGLAAPQVGVPIRLFICNPSGEPSDASVWVNPELIELSGAEEGEEGCLSIPGVNVPKRRATRAVISGFDLKGEPAREAGVDLIARIWQHETDHLNGVLVIDGMTDAVELANRRTLQQLESDYKSRGPVQGVARRR